MNHHDQALHALADILKVSLPNQELLTSLIVTPLIPPQAPSATYSSSIDGGAFTEEYGQQQGGEGGYDSPRNGGARRSYEDPMSSSQHSQYPHRYEDQNGTGNSLDDGDFGRPSPRVNGSTKWRKSSPVPAVVAVVSLAVNGDGVSTGREGLRIRAAAANLFQVSSPLLSTVAEDLMTRLTIGRITLLDQPKHNWESYLQCQLLNLMSYQVQMGYQAISFPRISCITQIENLTSRSIFSRSTNSVRRVHPSACTACFPFTDSQRTL